MIKIAIQVDSKDPAIREFLHEELSVLLERVRDDSERRGEESPDCRLDISFSPHSKEKIPKIDDEPTIM